MIGFWRFFLKGCNTIRVEGFNLNQFLSDCLVNKIELKDIKKVDEFTLTCTVPKQKLEKLIQNNINNKYRITVLKKIGIPFYKREAMQRKGFAIGLLIFLYLMYYQSLFITDIEIKGVELINESEILASLMEAGIVEGNKKIEELEPIKQYLYKEYEDIAWIGIKYIGNKIQVEIVEKAQPPEIIAYDLPCDIIATKKGFVEKIITKYGTPLVEKGAFVKEGDLLITGMMTNEEGEIKYVHSLGEVYAKIIYRFNITEEKTEIIKNETGEKKYGMRLKIGEVDIQTGKNSLSFDYFKRQDSVLFNETIPFPIKFCLIEYSEYDVTTRIRGKKEIENNIAQKVEEIIEKNIPKDAEITNKDLKFDEEKNIIKISVMVEAIEQIGREVKMTPLY